mmetsp:Transcript_6242/g.13479  ORF Transcript_6242/g.13479 Transcript_6242/m.13479 type:complete len:334 (-) Transcript_6242:246-1247(-)
MVQWFYVTGCDSGFGAIMVDLLSKAGHGVFAGVFMQETVEKLSKVPNVVPVKVDVTDQKSVDKAAEQIKAHLQSCGGKLNGVVNNAGIMYDPAPTELIPVKAYQETMDVNLYGMVRINNSVLPLLRESQGRVVNIASIAGLVCLPTLPHYCASKYAVEAYSDGLRIDMRPWGVTVHIIEPGVFPNTGLYQRFQTGLDKAWDATTPELRAAYGEDFKAAMRESLGKAKSSNSTNKDTTLVPKAVVHALTSARPLYRYKVGKDSQNIIPIVKMLPEAVTDWLFTRADPDKPWIQGTKPAGAPQDGLAVAANRYPAAVSWKKVLLVLLVLFILRRR